MPPGFDNFNLFCTQKSRHIVVPRLASVLHKLPKTIGHRRSNDFSFTSVFCSQNHSALGLSDIRSEIQTYVSTLQSALKQSYTEDTNDQNNDDKAKKPTLSSHSISVNYCNILVYFCITHNKFKAALTILSNVSIHHIPSCTPHTYCSGSNLVANLKQLAELSAKQKDQLVLQWE